MGVCMPPAAAAAATQVRICDAEEGCCTGFLLQRGFLRGAGCSERGGWLAACFKRVGAGCYALDVVDEC